MKRINALVMYEHLKALKGLPMEELKPLVGGLSSPSKMPCWGYSIDADLCQVGSKLAAMEGSVCHGCYAQRGNYNRANVKRAMSNRLHSMENENLWVAAMIAIFERLAANGETHFRWHDSGDLQSPDHLFNICFIHAMVPAIKGWLPTREYAMVESIPADQVPPNLTIRVSAHMVGSKAPPRFATTSMVVNEGDATPEGVTLCPAPKQGNQCLDCRSCWSATVPTVAYTKH